ncbi:hypothetical protein D3C85_775290 [compost metagenome]
MRRLSLLVAREHAAEEARLVDLLARVGIHVAHEVVAGRTVAVFDGETAAIERHANAAPCAVEGFADDERCALCADVLLHGRLLRRGFSLLHQLAGVVDVGTQIDHHAGQHGGVQARIFLAVLPLHLAAIGAHALFEHLTMADIDFGVAVDAFDAGAEFLALAAIPRRFQHRAQRLAQPAFRDLGAVFGPVRFDQASRGIVAGDGKAVFGPEVDQAREHVFGRTVDDQPAQITVALDAHVLAARKHIAGLRSGGLSLALLLELRVRRRARSGRAVARIAVRLGQIRRDAQRLSTLGDGALVVDRFFIAQELIDLAAAGQQHQRHQCRQTGMTFVHTYPHDI